MNTHIRNLAIYIQRNKILSLIVVLGAILRIAAVYPGYLSHGDELMFGEAILMLQNGNLSMEPQFFAYPPLVAWIMLVVFAVLLIPLFTIIKGFPIILSRDFSVDLSVPWYRIFDNIMNHFSDFLYREVLGINWVNAMYWGRYITALFGVGVIFLTYMVTKKYFKSRPAAFLAAFFVAVNHRLIISSHIGFIDMYNIFFLLLGYLAFYKLLKKPNLEGYTLSWILVALSFVTKYQIYSLMSFGVVHTALAIKKGKKNFTKFYQVFFNQQVIAGGLVASAIVLFSHYYHLAGFEKFIETTSYVGVKYGLGHNALELYAASYLYHYGAGEVFTILFVFGVFFAFTIKSLRLTSMIILALTPYLAYTYLYYSLGGFYSRNVIVMIPIILMFAAFAIVEIEDIISKRLGKRIALILASLGVFLVSYQPLKDSLIFVSGNSGVPNEVKTREWIVSNIPVGATIATNPSRFKLPQYDIVPLDKDALSYRELVENGTTYAVLDMVEVQGDLVWWMRQPPYMTIKFWNKPNDLLSQTYNALAFRELLWLYAPAEFTSPWQSNNLDYVPVYIESKIADLNFREISSVSDFGNWELLSYLPGRREIGSRNKSGDLVLYGQAPVPAYIRWQSQEISIKPNHGYIVSGTIELDRDVPKKERDAFLRIDFYSDKPEMNFLERPIVSFVSERVYGDSGEYSVMIEAISPENARYAVVGFQAGVSPISRKVLKEMSILESVGQVANIDSGRNFTIEDEDFFLPNDRIIL